MTCAEALQAILEADPSDLEGLGEGPLPDHLRGCSRCQAAAGLVLEEERALAFGLLEAVPLPDLDQILKEATTPDVPSSRKPPSWFRRAGLTLLPLAAAAAMAALFLGQNPQLPGEPYLLPQAAPGLGLQVPDGKNIAVLTTADPDITVLWYF